MAAPIAPKGAKSDKIWRAALMRAVCRLETDPVPTNGPAAQRLERLADALVMKGLDGDVPAIREIGDRLDGKPTQLIGGDEEAAPITARLVREIFDPQNSQNTNREGVPAAS